MAKTNAKPLEELDGSIPISVNGKHHTFKERVKRINRYINKMQGYGPYYNVDKIGKYMSNPKFVNRIYEKVKENEEKIACTE